MTSMMSKWYPRINIFQTYQTLKEQLFYNFEITVIPKPTF